MNGRKRLFLVALVVCSNATATESKPVFVSESITGTATAEQRVRVAKLFQLLVEMSRQPERINLNAVLDSSATTEFHPSFCVDLNSGPRSCSYNAVQSLTTGVRLNNLRTFTLKSESDAGAEITLEIDPVFACLALGSLQQAWGVTPKDGPPLIYDFFGGEEPRMAVKKQFYHGINRTAPYVFAEASSVGDCIVQVHLSAIHPPYN